MDAIRGIAEAAQASEIARDRTEGGELKLPLGCGMLRQGGAG